MAQYNRLLWEQATAGWTDEERATYNRRQREDAEWRNALYRRRMLAVRLRMAHSRPDRWTRWLRPMRGGRRGHRPRGWPTIRRARFTQRMISGDRAKEIEERLADLLDVEIAEVRDYLRGNIKESAARRTGFRFIRGTHGGQYVRDPEGTDIPSVRVSTPG